MVRVKQPAKPRPRVISKFHTVGLPYYTCKEDTDSNGNRYLAFWNSYKVKPWFALRMPKLVCILSCIPEVKEFVRSHKNAVLAEDLNDPNRVTPRTF